MKSCWPSTAAVVFRVSCGLAALAAIATGTACSKEEEKEVTPVVTVQTATVKRGPIEQVITSDAVLFPIQQSAITPKINAPVQKFYIQRGSRVKQGQLLATLENRDLRGALAQAEANYESTTKATVPEDLKKAQTDVANAKQELDAEQKLFDSRQQLFNQGALPRKDLDQARVALTQAQSQYAVAQQHLTAVESVSAVATTKSAAGQLETASANVSYSEIRAPISGIVTDRPLYPGEMASTSTPLLTIMDTSRVTARAHIPQDQAALLKVGDLAEISVPQSDTKRAARITLVSPATDPNSTTIEVWAEAPNVDGALHPGTTTQLSITAKKVADALTVPAAAVIKTDAGQAVMLVVQVTSADGCASLKPKEKDDAKDEKKDDKDEKKEDKNKKPEAVECAKQQPIQTGIQAGENIQVTSGLKEGQTIVATGAYGLPDGTEIKREGAAEKGGDEKDKDDEKGKDK